MPELPDVEVFRKYFNRTSLNSKIEKAQILDEGLLEQISPRGLQMRLKGKKFKSTSRHGKYMFARYDDNGWLILHFGMTGFLKYYKNDDKEPDHPRLLIRFSDGYTLAYDNQRKLGKVEITDDKDKFIEKNDLGPDPLKKGIDYDLFEELLSDRKGIIKSALMDQSLMCGIGNVYSDEILFRAKIHPLSKVQNLNKKESKKIYSAMRDVLKTAIEKKVDPDNMPRSFLLPRRQDGADCPRCSGTIKSGKINGRTSYYCKKHQKKY